MIRPTIATNIAVNIAIICGLLAGTLAAASLPISSKQQEITARPVGPFQVSGNRILDSKGRAFLMRGTQLTEFHLQTVARDNRAGEDFGAHSATSLSAVRLRFNMNTVRLPLDVRGSDAPNYFSELAKVVRRANDVELLVVLVAREPEAVQFWSRCAAYFKDYPNVMFDISSDAAAIAAIRSAGARQPIVVMAGARVNDSNVVYGASPRFLETRDARFGKLAERVPVIANWDLELHDAAACAALPSDPSTVAAMVQSSLDYFDAHGISWTASVLEPGKLVNDLSFHDATTLDNGWTCGQPLRAGLGRIIEAHLRASDQRGLFVVSGSGGPDVARGAMSQAYGPVLAAKDARQVGLHAPVSLGGISVEVTDSLGVTRPAGMLWAAAGWGQADFVVPKESAVGPAVMTIVRDDGSRSSSNITISDTAPGFLTGQSCRGPAIGTATEIFRDGRSSSAPVSTCKGLDCRTVPIAMSKGAVTKVRLIVSGFRYAGSARDIEVTIGGIRVPVVAYGADKNPGFDFLTIEIPDALRGSGETDLLAHINGRTSNAVRISPGGEKPGAGRGRLAETARLIP